jgi:hypothetical protein
MSLLAAGEERTTLNQARSATLQAGVSIRFGPKSPSDLPGAQFVPNTPRTAVTNIGRLGDYTLWFAVMITSAWRRPLTKILLDRVRDESGE